ncbi:MAG: sulfotransferase [Microcoleaceae cyanobacterium]
MTNSKNYPNFMIIGAMKCATSTLHTQLMKQPEIFMTELKEPNFFSDDEEYAKGMDWYCSLFEGSEAAILRGESSTHYTKLPTYPKTIERIQQHCPDAKFIYVIRHPIDRLVSQYIHEWSQRVISVEINQAISQHPELIDYSRYTMQLQPYFDTFGRDKVLPIFFENLLAQPQLQLEQVCQFLGYLGQPTWQVEVGAQNASNERLITSKWRDALVETPGLRELRQWLIPKSFRTWVRGLWTMQERPELTAENIKYLQEVFDEDLAILGSWLGIESLCCENFKEKAKQWQQPISVSSTP